MADIASLGIAVNTAGVSAADAALDRLAKAAIDATNAVNRMTAAATANSTQAGALAKQATTAASAHTTLATAARAATSAHGAHAAAMGNSLMAMREYEHSIRSIIDGLSAGMSPMRLFAMEGARLAQAYQAGGGAAGALQMFGSIVSKVMNPTVLLTGAVVGLGAAGFAAFSAWENRLGRSTGLTLSGLNNVALGAAGGRTSTFQAQSAIAAFAATGRIQPDLMRQIIGGQQLAYGQTQDVVEQYSKATGTSFSAATKTLAADFADPTRGAAELNKEFGLLGDRQLQLIRNFEASGQTIAAQGVLLGALKQDLTGAVDRTWTFAKAWDGVATAASNALAAVGHAAQGVFDPTLEERYRAAQTKVVTSGESATDAGRLRTLRRDPFSSSPDNPVFGATTTAAASVSVAQANADDLNEQLRRSYQRDTQRGRDFDAKQASIGIGDITRELIPDILQRVDLENQAGKLRTSLAIPGSIDQSGVSPNDASEALARLTARLANFATTAERVARDSDLASAATTAQTATQRTAIEAFKSWSDIIRDTGNYALAAATATAKWNEALATTQHRLDDESRLAAHTLETSTMRPYQRRQAEIAYNAANFTRDSVYSAPPGVSTVSPPIGATYSPPTPAVSAPTPIVQGTEPHLDILKANIAASVAKGQPDYYRTASEHAVLAAAMTPFGTLPASGVRSAGAVAAGVAVPNAGITVPTAIVPNPRQHAASTMQLQTAASNEAILGPQREAQDALDASARLLQAQKDTWGQMPGAIAAAEEKAKLYNEQLKQGVPLTRQMQDSYNNIAAQASAQAQDQANFQQQTEQVNQITDMARSFTSGSLGDVANEFSQSTTRQDILGQLTRGQQNAYYTGHMSLNQARMAAAQRQIQSLASKTLINYGIGQITKGIFGAGNPGSTGYQPGLLGGLINGGLGGLFGLGGLGLGGGTNAAATQGIGTFDAGFGAAPFFALGGVMTPQGPRKLPMFAGGGMSSGAAIFGEAGPEAAVPLPDGRSIPVALKAPTFGGGGAGSSVVVNHAPQTSVVIQGNADEKTIPLIQAAIAQNNAAQAKNLQRTVNNVISNNSKLYG